MKKIYLIIVVIIIAGCLYLYLNNTPKTEAPVTIPATTAVAPAGGPNIPAGTSISNEVGG